MKLKPFGCTVFHLLHPSFKMPSPKDFNFAYGFRPIYYSSRIFGLMPFTFVYNSKGKIDGSKVELVDILWLIISITINLTMAFMILGSTQYLYYVKSTSIVHFGRRWSFSSTGRCYSQHYNHWVWYMHCLQTRRSSQEYR